MGKGRAGGEKRGGRGEQRLLNGPTGVRPTTPAASGSQPGNESWLHCAAAAPAPAQCQHHLRARATPSISLALNRTIQTPRVDKYRFQQGSGRLIPSWFTLHSDEFSFGSPAHRLDRLRVLGVVQPVRADCVLSCEPRPLGASASANSAGPPLSLEPETLKQIQSLHLEISCC